MSINLTVGDVRTLGGGVPQDSNGTVLTGRPVTVEASDPSVLAIGGSTVTAIKAGSSSIIARCEGRTVTLDVDVAPLPGGGGGGGGGEDALLLTRVDALYAHTGNSIYAWANLLGGFPELALWPMLQAAWVAHTCVDSLNAEVTRDLPHSLLAQLEAAGYNAANFDRLLTDEYWFTNELRPGSGQTPAQFVQSCKDFNTYYIAQLEAAGWTRDKIITCIDYAIATASWADYMDETKRQSAMTLLDAEVGQGLMDHAILFGRDATIGTQAWSSEQVVDPADGLTYGANLNDGVHPAGHFKYTTLDLADFARERLRTLGLVPRVGAATQALIDAITPLGGKLMIALDPRYPWFNRRNAGTGAVSRMASCYSDYSGQSFISARYGTPLKVKTGSTAPTMPVEAGPITVAAGQGLDYDTSVAAGNTLNSDLSAIGSGDGVMIMHVASVASGAADATLFNTGGACDLRLVGGALRMVAVTSGPGNVTASPAIDTGAVRCLIGWATGRNNAVGGMTNQLGARVGGHASVTVAPTGFASNSFNKVEIAAPQTWYGTWVIQITSFANVEALADAIQTWAHTYCGANIT